MQKFLGIVCVVGGVLLVVWGQNISRSLGSQVHQTLTGSPPDKSMYLYLGGAALFALGAGLIFTGGKKR